MKKLDRFILKAFVGPFIAILLVVIFILMMQFLWLYIDELVGKGLGMKVILEFMMWGGCTIVPLALPLATLLASMMTLGSMTENNELMAIKASGVSLVRVMRPLIVASALIAVGAFFVGNNLVPKAYNEIFTLRDDIAHTKKEIKIPSGTFYDGIEGYVLRVEDQNRKTGMLYGVIVYDHTANKGNCAVTIADSAIIKLSEGKNYLTFNMYNGTNYQDENKVGSNGTDTEVDMVEFKEQSMVISLDNYAFEKSDDNRFGNQIKSQGISTLRAERDSLKEITDLAHQKHFLEQLRSSSFLKQDQFEEAFKEKAHQDFSFDGYGTYRTRAQKIKALKSASDKAKNMASQITGYDYENYSEYYYLRHSQTEILKKFSQALACFILFFIGAPLGAFIGKGGLGISAIISVLFFVLYWVVDISGTKLANDGAVAPEIGAFISSYVLFPIGAFLTWRAVADKPIFNMDAIKSWLRMATSKVRSIFRKTRIVYMGTPEFAVAPLDALIKKGYNVVGVVTVADKPSGRGLKVNQSAVKKYAVEHNLTCLQPLKLKDPEFLAQLKALKADMFVVVAFRMLPEEVWTMPKMGTFNLHAALLPQYRGAAPINWAVINGERITGATTFMIDKNIDTGGIILRQELRIKPEDTAGDVHDSLMGIGTQLVLETVEGIIQHNIETRTQRSFIQGSEVLKAAPKLTPELLHIDWDDTTDEVYNLIRGLSPYPTAYTELVKEGQDPLQLKIFKASKMDLKADSPGKILSDGKTYLAVSTADGAIAIEDLQLSGKKRMGVQDFLRGWRDPDSWNTTCGTSKKEKQRVREI